MLTFDSALPAGQYVVEFSQVAQSDMVHYLVLPMTQKEYPSDAVAYYRNGEKDENLTLRLAVNVDGELLTLIADGEDVPATQPDTQPDTQPETPPQTGDAAVAMLAVIAALAMGAAVVFAKKRAF